MSNFSYLIMWTIFPQCILRCQTKIMSYSPILSLKKNSRRQYLACIRINHQDHYGLNPAFFQRFWNEIHSDVYSSAFFWLDSSSLPPELNATNIVLPPKGDNPK